MKTKSDASDLKILGARDGRRISILLLNENPKDARDFNIALKLGTAGQAVDAGLKNSLVGQVPAQTSLLYVLDARGRVKEKVTYGVAQNLRHLPPEVERF